MLKDEKSDCPECRLVIDRKFEISKDVGKLTIHFSTSYDGKIIIRPENKKINAGSLHGRFIVDTEGPSRSTVLSKSCGLGMPEGLFPNGLGA